MALLHQKSGLVLTDMTAAWSANPEWEQHMYKDHNCDFIYFHVCLDINTFDLLYNWVSVFEHMSHWFMLLTCLDNHWLRKRRIKLKSAGGKHRPWRYWAKTLLVSQVKLLDQTGDTDFTFFCELSDEETSAPAELWLQKQRRAQPAETTWLEEHLMPDTCDVTFGKCPCVWGRKQRWTNFQSLHLITASTIFSKLQHINSQSAWYSGRWHREPLNTMIFSSQTEDYVSLEGFITCFWQVHSKISLLTHCCCWLGQKINKKTTSTIAFLAELKSLKCDPA